MQNPSRFDSTIRRIGDFPVPGVTFYDVTPLLSDWEAFREAVSALTDPFRNARIQKVVGAEARGFFVAPAIAHKLRAGFVPIRKPGKLPFRTRRHQEGLADTEGVVNAQNFVPGGATTYVKPYDFELHSDAIREGEMY
jgi:adenine phosphoribosyltransferase